MKKYIVLILTKNSLIIDEIFVSRKDTILNTILKKFCLKKDKIFALRCQNV